MSITFSFPSSVRDMSRPELKEVRRERTLTEPLWKAESRVQVGMSHIASIPVYIVSTE